MKTMMKMVTKALLLALAVGVARADPNSAQISGSWRTFAIAADNIEMVQEGGPLRMLLNRIECDTGCNALNVFFSVRRNSVCTPYMVVAQKNENGIYIAEYEGQNYLELERWNANSFVFTDYNRGPDGTNTRVTLLAVRLRLMNEERLEKFARFTEEQGIPRENILRVDDTDTCPP